MLSTLYLSLSLTHNNTIHTTTITTTTTTLIIGQYTRPQDVKLNKYSNSQIKNLHSTVINDKAL